MSTRGLWGHMLSQQGICSTGNHVPCENHQRSAVLWDAVHTEEADALRTSGEALHLDEAEVHGSEDLTALLNTSGDRNGSTGTARAHRTAATMNRLFMPLNSPRGCGGVMTLVIRPLRVAATKKLAQPGTDRQRTVELA